MPNTDDIGEPVMVMSMHAYNGLMGEIYSLRDRVGTLSSRNTRLLDELGRARLITEQLRNLCDRAAE
jgi:hypothetical protein